MAQANSSNKLTNKAERQRRIAQANLETYRTAAVIAAVATYGAVELGLSEDVLGMVRLGIDSGCIGPNGGPLDITSAFLTMDAERLPRRLPANPPPDQLAKLEVGLYVAWPAPARRRQGRVPHTAISYRLMLQNGNGDIVRSATDWALGPLLGRELFERPDSNSPIFEAIEACHPERSYKTFKGSITLAPWREMQTSEQTRIDGIFDTLDVVQGMLQEIGVMKYAPAIELPPPEDVVK